MDSAAAKPFRPSAYLRPGSIDEAIAILQRYQGTARVLAGGTDLLVERDPAIATLVDIEALDLCYIRSDAGGTRVGAATTLAEIAGSGSLKTPTLMALKESAAAMATPQIRNVATIGGNLCSASPAADLALPLLALDAGIRAVGSDGLIDLPLREFFVGERETVLHPDELLLEFVVPPSKGQSGSAFLRLARTSTDIALVNVSVRVDLTPAGEVAEARVVLGAVAPTPMRAVEAERSLVGRRITLDAASSAAETAAAEASPISDHRTTAEYRRAAAGVLVHRALLVAARRAESPV